MAELTTQDQATLAERFIDVPWCVYAQGLDEVFYCEHEPSDHAATGGRCVDPFERIRAIAFAENLRKSADDAAAHHGVIVPEITPFVLWHGVVRTYR